MHPTTQELEQYFTDTPGLENIHIVESDNNDGETYIGLALTLQETNILLQHLLTP